MMLKIRAAARVLLAAARPIPFRARSRPAVWRAPAWALGLLASAGCAAADLNTQSSDGQWQLHARVADPLAVGQSGEALVDIAAAAGGKSCPAVNSVVFEMPAHGHGGDRVPKLTAMGNCQFKVNELSPSMSGIWRLRLVLKSGTQTSNGDFTIESK